MKPAEFMQFLQWRPCIDRLFSVKWYDLCGMHVWCLVLVYHALMPCITHRTISDPLIDEP